jgi:glutamate/tyrosine decarboxylase-like PLP-dependent enzyme
LTCNIAILEAAIMKKRNCRTKRPTAPESAPLQSWFLGPKAEQSEVWQQMFDLIFQDYVHWRRNYSPEDPALPNSGSKAAHEEWKQQLNAKMVALLGDLKAHFPFYSQRYLGHMLSEQTIPSVIGYFAAMLYNPNNVTDEAAPVTVRLELEVGRMVAEMIGYNPRRAWAHICSGGTIANHEALWVARNVQFAPLVAQEFCLLNKIPFQVEMPNGERAAIKDLRPSELIAFNPRQSITVLNDLARFLVDDGGRPRDKVAATLTAAVEVSDFNVAKKGLPAALRALQMSPVIYVSAAGHYSILKAANALSYGEDAVRRIPVTDRFRINIDELTAEIWSLPSDRYIAAVVGVVGTTEEGAVDPIHQMHFMRQRSGKELNRSFWLHADAAYGGYFRSLFCGHPERRRTRNRSLQALCNQYAKAIDAREAFEIRVDGGNVKRIETSWDDAEVYSAFLAMSDADSVTIDPHKMGYTPYPAGIVAFRNALVTQFTTQRAQYISDEQFAVRGSDSPPVIEAVGPYILEGSKPGAAAAGCWLAAKTIPLTHTGHGAIIKASALSARKLTSHLLQHRHMFRTIELGLPGKCTSCETPFTFVPLYEPDTNVVCFAAVPMAWHNNQLVTIDVPLARLNRLNEAIYRQHSLQRASEGSPLSARQTPLPYGQPFFVSRTRFEESQYTFRSIAKTLRRLSVSERDYKREGLFVLRSAVMNPLYAIAEENGVDYLLEFVKNLHRVARTLVPAICWKFGEAA